MPNNMVDLFWHEHLLYEKNGRIRGNCQECREHIRSPIPQKPRYACERCRMDWHPFCVPSSPENFNHPYHPNHPLELLLQGPPSYSNGSCSLCQRKLSSFVYHCKLCDFSIDINCANNPPALTLDHPKCHEHALTLMAREVSFACNACGMCGERNPYVCLPCSLMFHYGCIGLPHVININRHDHRISHAYPLSRGNWVCEICRQYIDSRYGGYFCNKCPEFFAHSRCATRKDVWDGIELEGVPEEVEDNSPFKVIAEGVINHFSHEKHDLLLIDDVVIDGGQVIRCEACAHQISSEKHYSCMECDFVLHENCANLGLKRRHGLSTRRLSLEHSKDNDLGIFACVACRRLGSGFRYEDGNNVVLDLRCASLSSFMQQKLHPHTLFLTTLESGTCVSCDENRSYVLGCVECEYSLDFKCATLPLVVKHKCDAHLLLLSSGEKATGKYWCEICETETNPNKWFYTCNDCGIVCHIDCVMGDSLNIKPGSLGVGIGMKLEAVLNDRNSRPKCSSCGSRCRFPMVYHFSLNNTKSYHCSMVCLMKQMVS